MLPSRSRLPLALATAVLAMPVFAATTEAGPASSAGAARECSTTGRTVTRNASAAVRRRGPLYVGRYYGCASKVGRSFLLNAKGRQVGDVVTLAGTKVASMIGDADNLRWRVVVRNLRTGRVVHSGRANQADSGGDENGGPASTIVLRRNGAVAWLACVSIAKDDEFCKSQEVHVIGTDHRPRVLDVAPIKKLTLDGTTIRWTRDDGEIRSAPLE